MVELFDNRASAWRCVLAGTQLGWSLLFKSPLPICREALSIAIAQLSLF